MAIDSVTATQYTGYFQSLVRKSYEAGKVNRVNREVSFQKKLEEKMKSAEPIRGIAGMFIQDNESRGHDSKGELAEHYEQGELGKRVNVTA